MLRNKKQKCDPEFLLFSFFAPCVFQMLLEVSKSVPVTKNIFFYMWKGHRLEVHCTNIQ